MIRFASYPIVRAFTSIAVGGFMLFAPCAMGAENFTPGQVVGFEDAQGKTLFLHDFKGKPVLINLWASWCVPCVQEMPSLDLLQKEYAPKGLVIAALSEDESFDLVNAFYKKAGLPDLIPYLDKGHAVWTALEARGIPTTVLVNREGTMVQRIEGPVDWQSAKVKAIIDTFIK